MKPTNNFKNAIQAYLEQRAKEDSLFAATYAKKNKNIEECCNYILSEVKKSGCNGFADDEIFWMAVHYYDEDDIKNVKPIDARVVINRSPEVHEVKEPAKQVKKSPSKAKQELFEKRQLSLF